MTRHDPPSGDPDLVQAIEDFGDEALQIRAWIAQRLATPAGSTDRDLYDRRIRERMSGFALRAARMGLSGAALFELVNAAIDSKARRGRPEPSRDTSRTLLTAVANAHAREQAARDALVAAQQEVAAAADHRAACEAAAEAWGAKARRA